MSCPWKLERPTVGGHQHHDGGGRVPRAGPAACFGRIAGIEHASSTASTESPCTVLPVYLCTWVGRALLTPPFSLDAKKAWPCAAHVSVPQCCSLSRSLVHILDHFTPKRSGRATPPAASSCVAGSGGRNHCARTQPRVLPLLPPRPVHTLRLLHRAAWKAAH
jgi:hypothetical protein